MKIRAKIKGIGEIVEGDLVDINGEPCIFLLDKNNHSYIYGIYKESLEFWIKGKWRNIVEGVELINEYIGKDSVPRELAKYYKEKVLYG